MALWFVRLGETKKTKKDVREPLAHEYGLIMIHYGLTKDLSSITNPEKLIYAFKQLNSTDSPDSHISQVLHFNLEIKAGDFVVCPFDKLQKWKVRIGQFTKDFGPLKKLLTGSNLNSFSTQFPNVMVDHSEKLTRKVKWLTDYIPKSNTSGSPDKLDDAIFQQIYYSRATCKKLFYSKNAPHALAPSKFFYP